ncbi:MAG: hypothetical protein ACRDSP_17850 [Pseudonocardiaceae bacterium]
MSAKSLFRRVIALTGLVLLTAGATTVAATPAQAAEPDVALSTSQSTVHPGDLVTITQSVTNNILSAILQPAARILSDPDGIASFTSLVGCTGPAGTTCSTVTSGGQPIGYQALLPSSLSPGITRTVTYTLRINDDAPDLQETLQGQLLGLSFLRELLEGPLLIVDANADAAVSVTGTKLGLLAKNLDIAVTVTNNGPGVLRVATITTTLPNLLLAIPVSPTCVPLPGQVTCLVPSLAKGASTTLNFSVPLNLLSLGLPYTITSTRTLSLSRDLNPANDSASTSCIVVSQLLTNCT